MGTKSKVIHIFVNRILKNRSNMARIRVNSPDDMESISVRLTKRKFPIAFQAKVEELMDAGAFNDSREAEKWIAENPIELEIYYDKHNGLFAVECEVLECGAEAVCSPYTGQPMLDYED